MYTLGKFRIQQGAAAAETNHARTVKGINYIEEYLPRKTGIQFKHNIKHEKQICNICRR